MKKIAVFTSHVYEPMCGLTQKGINAAALELGVKVIYFASFSDSYTGRSYDKYSKYDMGDCVSFAVRSLTSGTPNSHGVTGGVYKTRERIHPDMLIRDY